MSEYNVLLSTDEMTVVDEYERLIQNRINYQSEEELENFMIESLVKQGYEYAKHIKSSDDAIKNQFECKLARVGYQHRDAEKYHAHRYRCANRTIFAITDDFPRLTKNCVPAEVVGAKYDLNLPAIERFQRQEIV